MTDSHEGASGLDRDARLAIEGGRPTVVDGPPEWPFAEDSIRDQLLAAWQDGSWGRYESQCHVQLVEKLGALHGVAYALPCCSGTFAVELALRGLKVRAGDEVVLAAYDFPGNFRAIEAVGAIPVLVDIDPKTWSMNPECLATAICRSTRAIMVSHLHGGLADMKRIMAIARDHGLGVVEDACQAPGATVQGRPAGTWGDVGALSFGGSKLLTAGRGGAIITADASVYQRAKIFGERGNVAFPLSTMQAAVLLPQLDALQQNNVLRRQSVQRLLATWRTVKMLCPVLPEDQPGQPAYYKVALRYDEQAAGGRTRAQFIETIRAEGVAVGPGFRGFVRRGVGRAGVGRAGVGRAGVGRAGATRCRAVGNLKHAANAAATTVLLHHPALLQPANQVDVIAHAFQKVASHFC